MKRFFKSIGREGSFKRLATSRGEDGTPTCAREDSEKREPTKFMSWNTNSFLLRLKTNREEVLSLLRRLDPDVIAIQEVRIPSAGRKGEPRNHGELKDDTNSAREDKQIMMRALSVSPLSDYGVWWSLSDSKYGGTALLVKHSCSPISILYSLDESDGSKLKHEADGRVILAEFHSFRLLNTYVPNNSWKDDDNGFARRRAWDARMIEFLKRPHKKPLIWCGDLNVSNEVIDVSHPDFFSNAKLQGYTPPNAEDIGQPGFTLGERQRFAECLSKGDLVDTYRHLHKQQDFDAGFTWSGNPVGKYRGKRMRIDYFLLSRKLLDRLVSSDIHGQGIEQEGFCGSDHCPITMEIRTATKEIAKVECIQSRQVDSLDL
ncbi:DNA-(apurinic or apyrimidinic site) endonuclease [Physcomitrium patens]|uniref:DNA-(apurinic or apyrimidinic site) endonuclease n=2 Tax=Physcomitrium patens TaxID=3218 RepID=A0A7I4CN86_PHYPA|nr:DNA-(apurinic or apyrimidinic site) lyase-like [Physcomitrium patens]|eukprot:XP_024364248.1 DNA-(apurinic or apyrimidinic site) lyase-like [Physcomitrella patens]